MSPAPSASEPVSVVLADDHALMRMGLRRLLQAHGHDVRADVDSGEACVEAVRDHAPAVVLMDGRMPGMSGPEATRSILVDAPATRVVMMSATGTRAELRGALTAGACGYLLKSAPPALIADAVRAAAAGHHPFSPAVATYLVAEVRHLLEVPDEPDRLAASLSDRERQILGFITDGADNQTIADALVISPLTVKGHVSAILAKLGVSNRLQAAVYATRRNLPDRRLEHEASADEGGS